MYGIAVGMAEGQFPSFVGCLPLLFLMRADIDRQHTLLGLLSRREVVIILRYIKRA